MLQDKHILIIVENLPVPFDARVWQEAQALKENGYSVSVICPKGKKEDRKRYQCLKGIRIYRYGLPFEASGLFGYLVEYFGALYWLGRLAHQIYKGHAFQVVQACNPPDLLFVIASYFKKKYGVKFVFDHHDLSPELYLAKFRRKDLGYRLMLYLEKRTFALADYSIATNDSYKKVAVQRGNMPADRVSVVRSGPLLERIYPVKPDCRWKRGKTYLMAYVGVIGKQDGLEFLIQAAHRIRFILSRNDLHFIIMGAGPDLLRVMQMSKDLRVDDMVEFTGRVADEQLRQVLSTADVCINPDEYNEMNDKSTMNKVMEYMAIGKPIVQFDLTEGRASAGMSSLYCRKNDVADLSEKILWLLDHAHVREHMGRHGRERVLHSLSWDYEKPKYLSLYNRVLGAAC